jgi:hypothetical protein
MRGQVQESANPKGGRGAWAILRMLRDAATFGRGQSSIAISLSRAPQEAEANVIVGLFKPILDAFQHQHHLQRDRDLPSCRRRRQPS